MAALKGLYSVAPSEHRLVDSFRDLSDVDISRLATILSHQPPPTLRASASQHRTFQLISKADIKKLPSYLQSHKQNSSHYSCSTHARLNPRLMRSMLQWIQHEIDITIPALLYVLTRANLLTPETKKLFEALREVSGMWVKPEEYRDFFDRNVNPRWAHQEDRCSACILSRMGGEADILTALKAGMLAITSSTQPFLHSKRHKYIDSLISYGFEREDTQKIFADAKSLGARIKALAHKLHTSLQESKEATVSRSQPIQEAAPADPQTPGLAKSNRAQEALSHYYSSIDDLINEYRKTVIFPNQPPETDLEEDVFPSFNPSPGTERNTEHALIPAPLVPSNSHRQRRAGGIISGHATKSFKQFGTPRKNAFTFPGTNWFADSTENLFTDAYAAEVPEASFADRHQPNVEPVLEGYHSPIGQSAGQRAASYARSFDVDAFLQHLDEENEQRGGRLEPILRKPSGLEDVVEEQYEEGKFF